ncbi:MAG TPA: flagellar biosynthesis protein FlhF [Capsulimonadaceae bacterium]|jgi:flagellar biosynthesis protein FlhF
MQMRTFRAATLEECFQQVKTEMGREAVILQTKQYRPIFGKFGTPRHEVIAALDLNVPDSPATTVSRDPSTPPARPAAPAQPATMPSAARPGNRPVYGYGQQSDDTPAPRPAPRPVAEPAPRPAPVAAPPPPPVAQPAPNLAAYDDRMERLEEQLTLLATSMTKLTDMASSRRTSKKAEAAKLEAVEAEPEHPYEPIKIKLNNSGVAHPLIRKLLEDLPPKLTTESAISEIRTRISQRLLIGDAIEPIAGKTRVIAFLGATGVGKTTTLTKIAARLSLISGYSVGVITMDTQRIAAAKQLETYGEILRLPVKIAYSAEELKAGIAEFTEEETDFVLVDTAGRSPNDAMPLAEVGAMLKEIPLVTKYLCVPATLSASNAGHMVTRFHSLLAPDALIVTKVDESADEAYLGHMLNVQATLGIPVAYLTNGQRVPDDLTRPDSHAIAEKVLPGSTGAG